MIAIVLVTNAGFHHERKGTRALEAHGFALIYCAFVDISATSARPTIVVTRRQLSIAFNPIINPTARPNYHLFVFNILHNLATHLSRPLDDTLAISIGKIGPTREGFVAAWMVGT